MATSSADTFKDIRAVIFDLDGTLIDSLADIADCMNAALARHGFPSHPTEAYRAFVGEGADHLARRAIPESAQEHRSAVLGSYQQLYAESELARTRPYEGIPQLLSELRARGARLAVLSNKPHLPTTRLVSTLFGSSLFQIVYGERPGIPRKPDPHAAKEIAHALDVAPQRCAFVGDTGIDMRTARAALMHAVGVTWGFRAEAELLEAGAQAIAHTPPLLGRILHTL